MEQETFRIKYICRMKDGQYSQQLLVNGTEYAQPATPEIRQAEQFFAAFAPRTLTKEGAAAFGENFVLVFRTDSSQMQAFAEEIQKLRNSAPSTEADAV